MHSGSSFLNCFFDDDSDLAQKLLIFFKVDEPAGNQVGRLFQLAGSLVNQGYNYEHSVL